MKNIIIILVGLLTTTTVQSQQLRYVNTDYILLQIPQYNQAKDRLNQQVNAWKSEISKEQEEIDNLERSLENERVILTNQKIEEKESVIETKKYELNQKIEQKFGLNGENQKLRMNLVKPLQDQIWNAINSVAQAKGYHMVFDKSSTANLIYADEKYDITDLVIKEMGLDKPQKNTPKPRRTIQNEPIRSNAENKTKSDNKDSQTIKSK